MRLITLACIVTATFTACGCNRNPFTRGQGPVGLQPGQQQANASEIQRLQQRLAQLDANNQDLHAQLARAKVVQDENGLLRQQLTDITRKYQAEQTARKDADQRLAAQNASMRQRGGATISANNSVREKLQVVDVPGFEVEQEGDLIRIQMPADQLFAPGTANLKPESVALLDRVANSIQQNYTKQVVGIEGHTDNTPLAQGVTHHQLAVSQALAVFQQLTSSRRLAANQLFIMGNGPNHPRYSNGDDDGRKRNRRIELVIYPERVE